MTVRTILVFLAVALAGCANPSVVRVDSSAIGSMHITRVYVPRFEGNPEFVEESTDMFIAELEPRIHAKISQGSAIRQESADILAGGNLAPTDAAIAQAKRAGAQVVVLGKVTSYRSGATLNGFSTVRVIDVDSGNVLASFHRPSGLLIGYSEHQGVMAAVKRTAEDVAKALR
ncbi:hypothetical protein EAH88_11900 [Rhodanobacter glycinis]|uniref:DUF4410 domain-containing protein n=1 Tax=Rhodanobacter glycinis TaxID=582702 RepID=A0A502C575_9GAMM|nr:hypothetical protein EAH88_11900 [Rhodanobacter glycinis]